MERKNIQNTIEKGRKKSTEKKMRLTIIFSLFLVIGMAFGAYGVVIRPACMPCGECQVQVSDCKCRDDLKCLFNKE
ncbi:UNVERIFIED_CONTAM: hypothetical protein RMT77_004236 [Armadillidium vulgare]